MKKILLSLLCSTLLLVEVNAQTTQEEIDATKAQIEALQASLLKLESTLPQNIQAEAEKELALKVKEDELITHAEFGFISTSGNTDTTSYNLDLEMKKGWNKHKFIFSFDGQYADDNDVQTKNKFLGELEYDYEFTDRFAFDYLIGYKQDKFSGYTYQAYTGPGAKYKLIKEEKHDLSLEGNILYSQDELEDTLLYAKTTRDYTSLRAKATYQWQILDNLSFEQELSYRMEVEKNQNYFVFSKTALISKISDVFSLGLNYKVDYVNTPPSGIEHSDKTFGASLIIDY